MMLPNAKQAGRYKQLMGLPEALVGEIINGQLHTQPRPAGPHADPLARTLETFELQDGRWIMSGVFKDDDKVSVPPFTEIALALSELWVEA